MELAEADRDAAAMRRAIQQLCSTNEQLEDERNSVLQPTSIEPVFRELLSSTRNIHVGWLFSPAGKKICGELALDLDNQEPGWRDLASELGMSYKLIMYINYDRWLHEGPTYIVLCLYAHMDDGATIGKVLEALYSIKRYDILHILKEYVTGDKGLIEQLRSEAERWGNDGYIIDELNRSSNDAHTFFSKPKLPPLPIRYAVFCTSGTSDIANVPNFSENMSERPVRPERLVTRAITESEGERVIERIPAKKTRFKAIVMLTFSVDGFSCAKSIASALRKKRIGVLILEENRKRIDSNPELFIAGSFPQVNYVIPIVTEGYLDALTAVSLREAPLTTCADARYVKLIYTLMANEYIQNGCINWKVRCIIPDGNEYLMQEHPVVRNRPVLQAWLPEREIEVLADSILSNSGPRSEE